MKKMIAALGTVALLAVAAGCGGNTCQDGCDKVRTCLQNLDCSKTIDPQCQITKAQVGAMDCNVISDNTCSGATKTKWDSVNSCTLDPQTCACPTTP